MKALIGLYCSSNGQEFEIEEKSDVDFLAIGYAFTGHLYLLEVDCKV